jgi:TatA/E family protein of Tat protein translocase
MFGSFGMMEILLILIVGVVVFGAIRLPRLARNISSGWHELKRLKRGFDLGLDENDKQPPRQHTQNYGHAQQQYNQPFYNENPDQQMNQQGNANAFYGQQEPPPPQEDGSGPSANSAGMSEEDDKKSG